MISEFFFCSTCMLMCTHTVHTYMYIHTILILSYLFQYWFINYLLLMNSTCIRVPPDTVQ